MSDKGHYHPPPSLAPARPSFGRDEMATWHGERLAVLSSSDMAPSLLRSGLSSPTAPRPALPRASSCPSEGLGGRVRCPLSIVPVHPIASAYSSLAPTPRASSRPALPRPFGGRIRYPWSTVPSFPIAIAYRSRPRSLRSSPRSPRPCPSSPSSFPFSLPSRHPFLAECLWRDVHEGCRRVGRGGLRGNDSHCLSFVSVR